MGETWQSPIKLLQSRLVWYYTRRKNPFIIRIRGRCRTMSDKQQTQGVRTVWWEEDAQGVAVGLLDQSLLPQEVLYLRLINEQEVTDAIKTLKVRGAPAIGVTAAFGMALALYRLIQERGAALTLTQARQRLYDVGVMLGRTRPTAVNLFWAIDRMQQCADRAVAEQYTLPRLARLLRG